MKPHHKVSVWCGPEICCASRWHAALVHGIAHLHRCYWQRGVTKHSQMHVGVFVCGHFGMYVSAVLPDVVSQYAHSSLGLQCCFDVGAGLMPKFQVQVGSLSKLYVVLCANLPAWLRTEAVGCICLFPSSCALAGLKLLKRLSTGASTGSRSESATLLGC